jgi:hypothetical protein
VAELERLAQRQLQDLLGAGGERDVAGWGALALADDLLDLGADRLQRDAERLQRLGGDPLALVDQAEQDVLGADVVVVEEPSLLLCEHDDTSSPVGEALKHAKPPGTRRQRSLPPIDYTPGPPTPRTAGTGRGRTVFVCIDNTLEPPAVPGFVAGSSAPGRPT